METSFKIRLRSNSPIIAVTALDVTTAIAAFAMISIN